MNEQSKIQNPKSKIRSLRTKIVAWFFIPTAIILIVVALVSYFAYQQVTAELVIERDRELTRLSAGQLMAKLTEYVDILAAEARTAGRYGGYPAAQRIVLQRASQRLVIFDGGVVTLNTFGQVVAAEPERPEILGQNWSNRAYFRQLIHSSRPVFKTSWLMDRPEQRSSS